MFKLATIVVFLSTCFAVHGQENWGWDVAAGGAYGKEINTVGPQFRAYILVDEHLCFGPEFSFFNFSEPSSSGIREDVTLYEFNFNAHYVFEVGHKFGVYPLAGLNWGNEKVEAQSVKAFGVNMGAGGHVFLGRWVPFLEYIYTTGEFSDSKLALGTYFIIHDIKK